MTVLTFMQRKALRRLGRGQTITKTMSRDPLIKRCYSTDHYNAPPKNANIVEWCDWEGRAWFNNRPRINNYGKQLLQELENGRNNKT